MDQPEHRIESLLLADMVRPVVADLDAYLDELAAISRLLREVTGPVRDEMSRQNRLRYCNPQPITDDLQAVDAAIVPLDRAGVCSILGLAVRVGKQGQIDQTSGRLTGENSQQFRQLTTPLRLQLELRLLATAKGPTIIDNSFWSLLMECNQAVTGWKSSSGATRQLYETIARECFSRNGTFRTTAHNLDLIAISKRATSDYISAELQLSPSIPDRILFTEVLRENEYTAPRKLLDATGGHFGVEHAIEDWEDYADLYQGEELQLTYYRPWSFQRAYRIEFHRSRYPDQAALESILSLIKQETSYLGILEPRNQFLADRICKQIGDVASMYELATSTRFSELAGPYRTGGT